MDKKGARSFGGITEKNKQIFTERNGRVDDTRRSCPQYEI